MASGDKPKFTVIEGGEGRKEVTPEQAKMMGLPPGRYVAERRRHQADRLECPICLASGGMGGHEGLASGTFLVERTGLHVRKGQIDLRTGRMTGKLYCRYCLEGGRPGMFGEPGLVAVKDKGCGWTLLQRVKD